VRALLFVVAMASCSSPATVHGIFVAPESLDELTGEHFFDHPFPSDIRRDPDGTIHLAGMLNPTDNLTVDQYIAMTKGLLDGFSPAAAAYFRFDGDLEPTSLPASPEDALQRSSSIQLVDIDPQSPEHGNRKLVEWYFRGEEGGLYWMPHTLAVAPAHGYPLRPRTRYAIVVTRDAKSLGGGLLLPSKDMLEVLELLPTSEHSKLTHDAFAPAVAELAAAGVPRERIVEMTVFTTNDPTAELFRVIDSEKKDFPAPTIDPSSWTFLKEDSSKDIYEGVYGPAPNYQAGVIPFKNAGDGGNFVFDEDGKPVVQGTFTMRFSLVVPRESKCPMPQDGYPLVLYAHGTGGDFESVFLEGNGFGTTLPPKCVAAMGVDQIFHGARPGAPPHDANYENAVDLLFFNLFNPVAARTNGRQAAVDVVQQARLFTDSHATIPALISRSGKEIRFDSSKLIFVGHSQGGVNGPLFLAADDQTRGGVLSGTGAMITVALLEKTQPSPSVANAVRTLLGLSNADYDTELNLFHPIINLAQTIVDTTDPVHYMPYIIGNPRHGKPKSIYQTEGIALGDPCGADTDCPGAPWKCNATGVCENGDSFAPPHGIEIASVAMGLPRELPGIRPVFEASFGNIGEVTVPPQGLSGNLANGKATGLLGQFPPAAGSDGHFVVFDIPACREQAAQFVANLAADPIGNIPPLP
jgi:predicted esterase